MPSWWEVVRQDAWAVSIMTPLSTPWERVLDVVDADLVSQDPVALIEAARSADNAPALLIPYLAAERSVDEFTSTWPEVRQRAVVSDSMPFHLLKATRPALVRALGPLGYQLSVIEWFEIESRPSNTFRVRVEIGPDEAWRLSDYDTLIRVANKAKNAHTLLETLEPVRRLRPGSVHVGGYVRTLRTVRIQQDPPPPAEIRTSSIVFIGGALRSKRTVRIEMRD